METFWIPLLIPNDLPVCNLSNCERQAKARQAISNYKKAVNNPAGLAELMVFYCERAAGFGSDIGYGDEGYLAALARMFEQAFITVSALPADVRDALVARLSRAHDQPGFRL